MAQFRKAEQLGYRDPELFARIGSLLMENDELEESMNYLRRSLQLDPNLEGGLCCMGDAAMKSEDYEEAKKYYEKALSTNPANSKVILNMGILHTVTNDYDKAIEYF
jgi:superkiller protein 3